MAHLAQSTDPTAITLAEKTHSFIVWFNILCTVRFDVPKNLNKNSFKGELNKA